jgi:hypothetical protein
MVERQYYTERGMARSAAALETEENEKIFVASLRRAFGNRHLTP